MDLVPLCEIALRYTALESLDYGAGGQLFGTMEGEVSGDRVCGSLKSTSRRDARTT